MCLYMLILLCVYDPRCVFIGFYTARCNLSHNLKVVLKNGHGTFCLSSIDMLTYGLLCSPLYVHMLTAMSFIHIGMCWYFHFFCVQVLTVYLLISFMVIWIVMWYWCTQWATTFITIMQTMPNSMYPSDALLAIFIFCTRNRALWTCVEYRQVGRWRRRGGC